MAMAINSSQTWIIVIAFVALLGLSIYDSSRDSAFQKESTERSIQAGIERQEMINLSKIIIDDIQKLSPEQEEKIIEDITNTFTNIIPEINENFKNHTEQVKQHDKSLKESLPKQANITLQKDNNQKLVEILEILRSGNNTR
jgi:division protein CdvB (Snf7/Vps24/ESCRT-III family)